MKKSVALGMAGLAVATVVGGMMVATTSFAATGTPAPASVALAAAGPVDLASPALRAGQKGAVVTVSKGKVAVATMTLADARYTKSSAHALVTITSKQEVKINTGQFKVFVDDGDHGLDNERVLTLPAGTHSVSIDAKSLGRDPRGFGWDGTADGVNAQWLRQPAPKTLDLASPRLHATQKGAVVTVLQGKQKVATMTLADARYTKSSAHALVTITSSEKVKINTGQFKVFVDDGDHGLDNERVLTLPAGTHSVSIDAKSLGRDPRGFGWDGTADDVNAQWLRP